MIDTSRLTKGLLIKNYNELCKLLCVKTKTGKSKQLQIEEFSRYFKYEKRGQSFIITEIYNESNQSITLNKTNKRNNIEYINIIAILISDLLAKDKNNGKVFLSKHRILKELKMINSNYAFCKQRILKLSKYTNIKAETIEEWYDSTDSALKRNLEKALDNLKNESLIYWSSEITVCKLEVEGYYKYADKFDINKTVHIDEYNEESIEYTTNTYVKNDCIREATDEEKKNILYVEREIMKYMDCMNKQEIIKFGKWEEFKTRVNKILLEEFNIAYYYESYKIIYNEDHICEKYESLINLLLNDEERNEYFSNLNTNIKNRIKDNAIRRQQRALKEMEENTDSTKLIRRSQDVYVKDNEKLTDILIDKSSKSIINTIKKTKL